MNRETSAATLLIVGAEVEGRKDVAVRLGTRKILEVGRYLRPRTGEQVLDAAGGALIPGLHDHHVHLRAQVAACSSVNLAAVEDPSGFDREIRSAAVQLAPGAWLRGVGWHESSAGQVDRARLDALESNRPIRLQHRGGALWVLNTLALSITGALNSDLAGVERDAVGEATGRLWRMDQWLHDQLPSSSVDFTRNIAALAAEAAAAGITGFTDATPGRTQSDIDALSELSSSKILPQHLVLMAPPGLRRPGSDRARLGAMKIILDDVSLPLPDELAKTIQWSHRSMVPVAVHCVSAEQLVIATAALEIAGPLAGDRIEHASVVPPGYPEHLRSLGVGVVTQPGFIADRGDDYLRDVEPGEQAWLYPCGSLQRLGVPVAAGTDAPFGPADPWVSITAAIGRQTAKGRVLGAAERVDPRSALNLFMADPDDLRRLRRVQPGEPADLCLLHMPLLQALLAPGRRQVRTSILAGLPMKWEP